MDEILSGFRIGGTVLWTWMLWRVLFDNSSIHNAPDAVRRAGWVHFRRFIILMGTAIVVFAAPENILRASGKIDHQTSMMMNAAASFLVMIAGILVHHGLDIATERKSNSIGVYVVIVTISILYSFTAVLL